MTFDEVLDFTAVFLFFDLINLKRETVLKSENTTPRCRTRLERKNGYRYNSTKAENFCGDWNKKYTGKAAAVLEVINTCRPHRSNRWRSHRRASAVWYYFSHSIESRDSPTWQLLFSTIWYYFSKIFVYYHMVLERKKTFGAYHTAAAVSGLIFNRVN